MHNKFAFGAAWLLAALLATSGMAAEAKKAAPGGDQPIEISADMLDVHQDEHKAIFSGNVIATQGTSTLRSKTMTVFYHQADKSGQAAAAPAAEAPGQQGISRIEAEGEVVLATEAETAQGDKGIYNAENETIELTGRAVTLTRDKNVLKGQKLVYNMKTGRSTLTAGGGVEVNGVAVGKPGRVHGLFVSKSDKKKQDAAP